MCFPKASITLVYGCTECEPIAFGEAQYYLDNNLSGYFVGHPIAEVKIHQEPFPLWHAPGAFIISLSGANVVLANQILTHQTGDIATYDKSGGLWLLGRTADLIQLPQGITAPAAFEIVIEEIPGIIRVALIQRSQSVFLFYEGLKGLEEQIIEKLFVLNIAIDWIVHLEKIPVDRRHQWKIQRSILQVEGKFPGRVFKKTYVSSKVSNS